MRVKITFAYNGAKFNGSQFQTLTSNTVIGNVQEALSQLHIHEKPIASGRTDKGVHATKQVMHLDLPPFWTDFEKLKYSLNLKLSPFIVILRIEKVSSDFHSRFWAKKRLYRYIVKRTPLTPFEADYVTYVRAINSSHLQHVMQLLLGTHDFSLFKKSGSETAGNQCTFYRCGCYDYGRYTVFYFEANRFLRMQIRLIMGFLLKINEGSLNHIDFEKQISGESLSCSSPAPSSGLYLSRISY